MSSTIEYTKNYITSNDGTRIGYRQFGEGTGLILVHGGMMASRNLMKLGALLAGEFTIYIPDRRGRGLSQANSRSGLTAESEDLQALVNKTRAENIYGLSAGAVITLQTSVIEKSIKKIVLHEPPILIKETKTDWMKAYNEAMRKGNYGKAFISVVKGTDDPTSFFNILPKLMTAPLMNIAIKREAKKSNPNSDDVTLKSLLTAMHYDIKVVEDSEGLVEKSKNIATNVLLLKGQKSQLYLRTTIDLLSLAFSNAKCVELLGQGHTVSNNDGRPELVAAELRQFFVSKENKSTYPCQDGEGSQPIFD